MMPKDEQQPAPELFSVPEWGTTLMQDLAIAKRELAEEREEAKREIDGWRKICHDWEDSFNERHKKVEAQAQTIAAHQRASEHLLDQLVQRTAELAAYRDKVADQAQIIERILSL